MSALRFRKLINNFRKRSSARAALPATDGTSASGISEVDQTKQTCSATLDLQSLASSTVDAGTVAVAEGELPRIDGFTLRAKLGGDGQGDVYRAFDLKLQCEVALKIPRSTGSHSHEQFIKEARALAKVRHPNVVSIYAYGRSGRHHYFTMDLIDGPDVGRLIQRMRRRSHFRVNGRMFICEVGLKFARTTDEVRRAATGRLSYYRLVALWMAQAAEGLAAAHDAGVLHRDIKPSNLLLSPDGRMMVADFGLARSMRTLPTPTATGVVGTFPYIAPERASGLDNVDFRSDVWALGATMYELLTLQRAYSRNSVEVLQDITTRDPQPPSTLRSDVPAELQHICLRAMQRDPDRRYQSWRDFAQELRTWLAQSERKVTARFTPAIIIAASIAALAITPVLVRQFSTPEEKLNPQSQQTTQVVALSLAATTPLLATGVLPPPSAPNIEPPASAANTGPLVTKPQPPTVDTKPILFLACNQDLNRSDSNPPTAGGAAERHLRRKLSEKGIELRDSLDSPPVWRANDALAAAEQAGANILVLARFEARVLGRVQMEITDQAVYRWELGLNVKVVRLSDRRSWTVPVEPLSASVAATRSDSMVLRASASPDHLEHEYSVERRVWALAGEFGGDAGKVTRLANAALTGIVEILDELSAP